jgi:NADH-quinone oxidoreductase subunit A
MLLGKGLYSRAAGLIQCHADPASPRTRFNQATMLQEYIPVLIFLGVAAGIGLLLLGLGFLIGSGRKDKEKLSPYECGFEPFDEARMKFDVRYYLVAILFIIFDLEIAFLFPWAVSLDSIGAFGLLAMALFLTILVVGFIYEWKKGALEWD